MSQRDGHDQAVKRQVQQFFEHHAEAYRLSPSHRAGRDLARLIDLLDPKPGERALDVATGAGHTAFALAGRGVAVTGLDLTPAMEAEFRRGAEEHGLTGLHFQVGDAEALPFDSAAFDIVTCRRAAHHFPRVGRAVDEMGRVLRPGGRLGIVDMVTPDDDAVAELMNHLERVRDGSHQRALSAGAWRRLVTGAGLAVRHAEIEVEEMPFDRWLYPVAPDSREGLEARRLAEAALARQAATVAELLGRGAGGELLFRKRRIVLVAVKAA